MTIRVQYIMDLINEVNATKINTVTTLNLEGRPIILILLIIIQEAIVTTERSIMVPGAIEPGIIIIRSLYQVSKYRAVLQATVREPPLATIAALHNLPLPPWGRNEEGSRGNWGQSSYYNDGYYLNDDESNKAIQTEEEQDWVPEGTVQILQLQHQNLGFQGLCLFDSGSATTIINRRAIPFNDAPKEGTPQVFNTTQGQYQVSSYIEFDHIKFPEFAKSRSIPLNQMRVFDNKNSK
jgi:hypothetical protein